MLQNQGRSQAQSVPFRRGRVPLLHVLCATGGGRAAGEIQQRRGGHLRGSSQEAHREHEKEIDHLVHLEKKK